MGIADLFRPKYRHSDVRVRTQAVKALTADDAAILVQVARTDRDIGVRRIAIEPIELGGRTVAPDDDAEFLRQLREDAAQDERIRRMEQELAELDADEPPTDGGTGAAGGGTAGGKTPGRTPGGATSGDALGSGDTLGTERKHPDAPDAPGTPGEAGPSGRPNG